MKIYEVTVKYVGGKYQNGLYTTLEKAKAACQEEECAELNWAYDEVDCWWIGKENDHRSTSEYLIREVEVL
ncbi:hypothetical protein AU106_gp142 [Sinorhizobium phage phiM9]|uniref:Uncharacterized protein n=1 Tax=Sinorhizobium phage phiM9 TaxID=1636182 RepID=A0A0F6R7L3_9CAUD|nr:hypothetical protein AU106_gp142 [Sinorhizobium phage phiM9]AKE44773.1 hypothetical protein Sm_phiM9_145 [Sinorhizobium phage phiM9]